MVSAAPVSEMASAHSIETMTNQESESSALALRVLHVLDHSWPLLSGYSVRSRRLVSAQKRAGFAPAVLTGPLHEVDDAGAADIRVDGLSYYRTPLGDGLFGHAIRRRWPLLRELAVVRKLQRHILCVLDRERFDVVHAHSPALCGLAAWRAARARGLPFVYEVRAFWEDAAAEQNRTAPGSLRYALTRHLEGFLVRQADAVVGISRLILNDLKDRGIMPDKLFYVPNGVESETFQPLAKDVQLAAELRLGHGPVLGFVGSLYRYEGMSWLVQAAARLRQRGLPVQLVIVGDGEDTENVRRTIEQTGGAGWVRLVGRVPHEQVRRYYSLMDVMAYPRCRTRLTELTTPLKPLEAMAQGKPVLASDVGGIRELFDGQPNCVLFRAEDVEDFCEQAERLLRDSNFRRELSEQGRWWVVSERDWKVLARRYATVYSFARKQVCL